MNLDIDVIRGDRTGGEILNYEAENADQNFVAPT